MSDEVKSSFSKPRKIRPRILVVNNPGPDSSSSSSDDSTIATNYHGYSYQPTEASASTVSFTDRTPPASHIPTPLTTNLPQDHRHHGYPSSRSNPSNPALSSPSSTSSQAVESTPPPSTPGQANPPVDLSGESTLRQEPVLVPYPDGSEPAHCNSRTPGLFTKFKNHLPRSSHSRRMSNNRPATSPTTSIPESYASQSTFNRPSPAERVTLLVTTDAEHLVVVDITGAASAEVIREKIFAKLQVPDEDQVRYSIYRTEIGKYAIGGALTDEQLYDLYRNSGDDRGTIKLLVSHAGVPVHVHDAAYDNNLSPTVNTIPPPVLPHHNQYPPLRPRRRSKSRRGSISSAASERLPPEVGAGYEASVSDDLDQNDVPRRPSHRSPPLQHTTPRQGTYRQRSPTAYGAPHSPGGALSPDSARGRNHEVSAPRMDRIRANPLPTPPAPPRSPDLISFHDYPQQLQPQAQAQQAWATHGRSGSDAALDRERALMIAQDEAEKYRQREKEEKEEREKLRRREGRLREPSSALRRAGATRDNAAAVVNNEPPTRKPSEGWQMVPSDIPSSAYAGSGSKKDQTLSPQDSRSSPSRYQGWSPYSMSRTPRAPPATPPGVDTRGSRKRGQPVPPNWAISYKNPGAAGKAEPPPVQPQSPPGPSWSRMMATKNAKSMNDIRAHFLKQQPPSQPPPPPPQVPSALQPGRARPQVSPLPVSSRPSASSTSAPTNAPGQQGDNPSSGYFDSVSELGKPKSFDGPKGPLASPLAPLYASRPAPPPPQQQYPSSQRSASGYLGASSSVGQDAYSRPGSSNTDTNSPHRMNQPVQSPNSIDYASPNPLGPRSSPITAHYPAMGTSSLPYRDDYHSIPTFGPRPNPSYARTMGGVSADGSPSLDGSQHGTRSTHTPPRSPLSLKTPPFEPTRNAIERKATDGVKRTLSSLPLLEDEPPSATEPTIRRDDVSRYMNILEQSMGTYNPSGSATIMPLKPQPPIPPPSVPLPPPPSQPRLLPSSVSQPIVPTINKQASLDSDSSDSEGGGTIWAKAPTRIDDSSSASVPWRNPSPAKSQNSSRPVLPPIDTDSSPNSRPVALPRDLRAPPPNFPGPPGYIPDPPEARRRPPPANRNGKTLKDQRTSRFDNNFDVTWAPRPPVEEVYERLQEYFPEHDVDEPVIEAPSGGASPTSAEPSPIPQAERRFRHKKSIRYVAAEHKKRIDRTSHMETTNASNLRKRNTKLWGSRVEEVKHDDNVEETSLGAADGSPGTAKPIFRWVRGELIGKGTYGKVYLALNATTGEMIAVKQVEMPRTASDKDDSRQISVVEALKLESETLKDLDHPNIVQYLGFEETPSFLSIFLEYVPGGSIASCLRKHGKFDEEVTKSFTGQILSGLEYLHSKSILHRDMKADNILVETSGICKISDFGISKRSDDIDIAGAHTAMQGTVFWMAPEVIDASKKGYNSKIDIWSVGCVVFEMWTGQRPWNGKEAMAVLLQLYQTKQGPPVPPEVNLTTLADDFRQKCFAMNPDERPSAAELRKHPYLELQPDWTFSGFS